MSWNWSEISNWPFITPRQERFRLKSAQNAVRGSWLQRKENSAHFWAAVSTPNVASPEKQRKQNDCASTSRLIPRRFCGSKLLTDWLHGFPLFQILGHFKMLRHFSDQLLKRVLQSLSSEQQPAFFRSFHTTFQQRQVLRFWLLPGLLGHRCR